MKLNFSLLRELVSILIDLENKTNNCETSAIGKTRFSGYFCSDTVSNLSRKVLTDNEIKVLEKGLDYASIQSKTNQPDYEMILKSFVEGCALSGIFAISLPLNSVRHLHLHLSLPGNHLKVILLLKYF